MTSGEYLKNLLKEKGITVRELNDCMGFKSRNVLYRLFGNSCSPKRAAELAEKIAAAMYISQDELEVFYSKLENGRESGFFTSTRAILMQLYRAGRRYDCAN